MFHGRYPLWTCHSKCTQIGSIDITWELVRTRDLGLTPHQLHQTPREFICTLKFGDTLHSGIVFLVLLVK